MANWKIYAKDRGPEPTLISSAGWENGQHLVNGIGSMFAKITVSGWTLKMDYGVGVTRLIRYIGLFNGTLFAGSPTILLEGSNDDITYDITGSAQSIISNDDKIFDFGYSTFRRYWRLTGTGFTVGRALSKVGFLSAGAAHVIEFVAGGPTEISEAMDAPILQQKTLSHDIIEQNHGGPFSTFTFTFPMVPIYQGTTNEGLIRNSFLWPQLYGVGAWPAPIWIENGYTGEAYVGHIVRPIQLIHNRKSNQGPLADMKLTFRTMPKVSLS